MTEYVPLEFVRAIRNSSNRLSKRETTSYSCLLADKFIFSQYALSLNHAVVPTVGLCTEKYIEWMPSKDRLPLCSLWGDNSELDVFVKPVTGSQGDDVHRLTISNGAVTVNDEFVDEQQLSRILSGTFVMQHRIVQHPELAALNPRTVNTIRLLTHVVDASPIPVVAGLRIGHGESFLDNWNVGGMITGIDMWTGRLNTPAYLKNSGALTRHPTTGAQFEGLVVPFFREAVDAACRLHADIPRIHSIGWDIAITQEGPLIIEGNENWDPLLLVLFAPASISGYIRSAKSFENDIEFYRPYDHA